MTDRLSTQASLTTSGVCAAFGAMTANEIAAYGGLLLAALTFLVNAWFQWDRRRREIKQTQVQVT